jgi:hypothetical protein
MEKTLELVEGAASKRPVGWAACGGGAAGTHGTAGDAPGRERAGAGTVLAEHARIEAAFRDGAFTRAVPNACRGKPACQAEEPDDPAAALPTTVPRRCRAVRQPRRGWQRAPPRSPRVPERSPEHSLREARHDNYLGVQHLTLALVTMNQRPCRPSCWCSAHHRQPCVPPPRPLPAGQLMRPRASSPSGERPSEIGPIARAALVLTLFEHKRLA